MDPCGVQKKIKGDEYRANFQKVLDDGGEKDSYGGGLKREATNKKSSSGDVYKEEQGKVRGATTHVYGLKGDTGVRKNG